MLLGKYDGASDGIEEIEGVLVSFDMGNGVGFEVGIEFGSNDGLYNAAGECSITG